MRENLTLVHEKNKGADQPSHLCVESDQYGRVFQ